MLKTPNALGRLLEHEELDGNFSYLEELIRLNGLMLATEEIHLYVSPTGNDSYSGLSSGAPLRTIAKAIEYLRNFHHLSFVPVIHLADGEYTERVVLPPILSNSPEVKARLVGNETTPGNVHLNINSTAAAIGVTGSRGWQVESFKVSNAQGGALQASNNGDLNFGNLVFGACASNGHIAAIHGGVVVAVSDYRIEGNCPRHWHASRVGTVMVANRTITLANTPAFSDTFANASINSNLNVTGNTFVGSATGVKYRAATLSVVNTGTGNVNALPGTSTVSVSTGGVYT